MNENEIEIWVKRNIESFSNESEAREYIMNRIREENAKKSRVLRVFKNIDEYRTYAENAKMGEHWDYDSDDFEDEYDDEYEDYVAVCAYEYV